jgi:hypothetical protein
MIGANQNPNKMAAAVVDQGKAAAVRVATRSAYRIHTARTAEGLETPGVLRVISVMFLI